MPSKCTGKQNFVVLLRFQNFFCRSVSVGFRRKPRFSWQNNQTSCVHHQQTSRGHRRHCSPSQLTSFNHDCNFSHYWADVVFPHFPRYTACSQRRCWVQKDGDRAALKEHAVRYTHLHSLVLSLVICLTAELEYQWQLQLNTSISICRSLVSGDPAGPVGSPRPSARADL